jgi:hypothetical protein
VTSYVVSWRTVMMGDMEGDESSVTRLRQFAWRRC